MGIRSNKDREKMAGGAPAGYCSVHIHGRQTFSSSGQSTPQEVEGTIVGRAFPVQAVLCSQWNKRTLDHEK